MTCTRGAERRPAVGGARRRRELRGRRVLRVPAAPRGRHSRRADLLSRSTATSYGDTGELIADSDEKLGALLVVALGPPVPFLPERWHGRPLCGVVTCWSGAEDEDDRIRARLADLGPVVGQYVERMPYPVINTLFDELLPAGLFHYWKGTFSQGLPDGAIDAYVEYGATTPTIQSATVVFPIDGACHRVGPRRPRSPTGTPTSRPHSARPSSPAPTARPTSTGRAPSPRRSRPTPWRAAT